MTHLVNHPDAACPAVGANFRLSWILSETIRQCGNSDVTNRRDPVALASASGSNATAQSVMETMQSRLAGICRRLCCVGRAGVHLA